MPLLAWRHVTATIAVPCLLGGACAVAAPTFTTGGDGAFRTITATGGALPGVDVSGALVQANGSSTTLATVALQAAGAVPLALAGQPNGWLRLDGNGLVPPTEMPASAIGVDTVARSSAAAAASEAGAAIPASQLGKPNGVAPLDANALVPLALLPSSVTSPVDSTARSAASAADTDARAAQSTANSAVSLASAAVPTGLANAAKGWLQLDGNGLIPPLALPNTGIGAGACTKAVFDQTGRATSCAALSGKDVPTDGATIGVDANGNLTTVGGPGVDTTARTAAAAAQSVANAAIPVSQIGVTVPGLDSARSLSQSLSAAAADATQRTFAQHWNDTINAADYGVDCDAGIAIAFTGSTSSNTITSKSYVFGPDDVGRALKGGYYWGPWRATVTGYGPVVNGVSSATVSTPPNTNATNDSGYLSYVTDNSAAMQRVYQHYLNAPKGAMVSWPIGKCDFSQTQNWIVAKPLRFSGMGIGATQFVMTTPNTLAWAR